MSQLTVESFTQLVRASGLVADDQLAKAVQLARLQNPGRNADSRTLSQYLLEQKLITQWHYSKLSKGCSKGFFIGKYKLLQHLGTGGMSRVYLAVHTMMKRQVAIKVLNQKLTESESHLQRFLRESQAAASLDHPNVVRAYDVDCDKNLYYFVMEYVEGPTLQQLIEKQGPLPYEYAADYLRQSAEGLQHAHDAKLVHRDIKPGNLLVNANGVVKVLDLGMVRLSSEEVKSITIQFNESMLGTADYLAPEQALDSHNVDSRADIYSLGCTFYFILTGHPPFAEGSMAMRLMRHQSEEPPSILIDRPDCPEELIRICSKMMAKQPDDRYANCTQIAAELQAWLNARKASGIALPPSPVVTMFQLANAGENGTSSIADPAVATPANNTPTSPTVANTGPTADTTARPADFNVWKYQDFELSLLQNDSQFIPAIKTLCQRCAGSEKLAAFLVRLLSAPELPHVEVNPQALVTLLVGLSAAPGKTATKTLMRIVVGGLNLGKNDKLSARLAVHALAEFLSPEREKFLVEVLVNAEEARPAGRSQVTPNELRMHVAKVLMNKINPRLKTELQARLNQRNLVPEAQKLIVRLLQ